MSALQEESVFAKMVNGVTVPFHTPYMEKAGKLYGKYLGKVCISYLIMLLITSDHLMWLKLLYMIQFVRVLFLKHVM